MTEFTLKTQDIWQKQKLGCLFSFHRSLSASRAQLGEIGIPYLHYGDIHKTGKTSFDPEKDELPKLDYRENAEKYLLKNGDIVFVDASEDRKDASRFCVIKNKNNIPFLAGLHTVVARPKSDELNINFSEFLFQSNDFRKQVSILANGMKVFGISKDILSNIVIRYPQNTAEQEKIAEILGTWDSAIEKLTALIAAKRLQKKGLMQKLLTAQIRLPGFTDEWQKVKLGELLNAVSLRNTNLNITRVLSVTNKYGFTLPEQTFSRVVASSDLTNYKVIKKGEFAYNPSRLNVGSIDRLDTFEEGVLSPMYVVFQCNKRLVSEYMKQWILTDEFTIKVKGSAQGSVRETVDFKTLSTIKIHIPTDISEQKAIADILSKADEEIDLLTRKLDLIQSQKKGLMQQLLTGKIRVKVA